MAKPVDTIDRVKVHSITSLDKSEISEERKEWLSYCGTLIIMESEHKHPGKFFAMLIDDAKKKYFTTSCGELAISQNNHRIRILTDRTEYIFDISGSTRVKLLAEK